MGDMTNKFRAAFDNLIQAPMMAISDPEYAVGFAVIEYASDWAQVTGMNSVGDDWKRFVGALVRGFMFQTSLEFWEGTTELPK